MKVTHSAVRSIVEQYSPVIFGVRYSLRLEWLVIERKDESSRPTYQLRLNCLADKEVTTGPIQMRMVVPIEDLSNIPRRLEEVFDQQSMKNPMLDRPSGQRSLAMRRLAASFLRGLDAVRVRWRYQL